MPYFHSRKKQKLEKSGKEENHLCRGARDWQLEIPQVRRYRRTYRCRLVSSAARITAVNVTSITVTLPKNQYSAFKSGGFYPDGRKI
jgi:hypothetical protein